MAGSLIFLDPLIFVSGLDAFRVFSTATPFVGLQPVLEVKEPKVYPRNDSIRQPFCCVPLTHAWQVQAKPLP